MENKFINQDGVSTLISLIKGKIRDEVADINTQITQDYYDKNIINSLLNSKQNKLIAGKDIEIILDTINNEHSFFTNNEIESAWNSIIK